MVSYGVAGKAGSGEAGLGWVRFGAAGMAG